MIYTIEYLYEDGSKFVRYFTDEAERNFHFDQSKNVVRQCCVRKRDYKEVL